MPTVTKTYYHNIDLDNNQLLNAVVENRTTAPLNPVDGQIYYNTVDKKIYSYNVVQSTWNTVASQYVETDPIFTASAAFGITSTNISNWNSAYLFASTFPSQTGNTGKFLTTNGTALSWADVITSNIYTADGTLTGNRTVNAGGFSLTLNPNTNLAGSLFGNTLRTRNSFSGSYTQPATVFSNASETFDGLSFTGNTLYMGQSNIEVTGGSTTVQSQGIDIEQNIKLSGASSRIFANNYIIQYRGYTGDVSTNANNLMVGLYVITGHAKYDTTTNIVTGNAFGYRSLVNNYGGSITNASGYESNLQASSFSATKSSTITNYYAFRSIGAIGTTSGPTATITHYYGLFLNTLTVNTTGTITNRWGVYAPDPIMKHHINGVVLIGSASDSTLAKLQVTGAIQQTTVTSSLLKTDGNGVLVAATLGTDYSVLPSQSGNSGKFLTTNGTILSWADVVSGVSSFNTRTGAVTLSSLDVTTALGYTPVTSARTLTINGTAFDLSADRSWTIAAGITGSGVAGQVAYWNGTNSQTGSNNLVWDNTNQRLSITGQNAISTTTISAICASGTFSLNNASQHYVNTTLSQTSSQGSVSNVLSNNSSLTGAFVLYGSAEGNNLFGTSRNNALALLNNNGTKFYIGTINSTDLIFGTTNLERMRLFAGGNFNIGGAVDGGQRLQVIGDARISNILYALGGIVVGTDGSGGIIRASATNAANLRFTIGGSSLLGAYGAGIGNSSFLFTYPTSTNTDAATHSLWGIVHTFAPTSGTTGYIMAGLQPTINQTGGANGITRGLYVNPTLTSAPDWRSIETTNNSGYAIYAGGTASSYFGGIVGIGGLPTAGYTLRVYGNIWATGFDQLSQLAGSSGVGSITFYDQGTLSMNLYGGHAAESVKGFFTIKSQDLSYTTPTSILLHADADFLDHPTMIIRSRNTSANSIYFQNYHYSLGALFTTLQPSGGNTNMTFRPNRTNRVIISDSSVAALSVESTTQGFLPPRMTATQRGNITTPAVGLIVYQTDGTEGTYEYASTGWRIINSAAAGGAGTVTSVGLSLPSIFTVSNSPVTSTGTLTATLATQTANTIFAGPTTGVAAAPTFRAIVAADIPTLNQNTTGSAATLTTARTITIGSTGKTFNGSADVSWTLAEIGAYSSANPSGYTNNTGTVTTVSVVTANGISATYTNQTTTPAITLSLGAITPTSVNSVVISGSTTPTLAVTGTSSISGSNTGDNAVNSLYSGLVSNATHTGDATGATSLTVVGLRGVALPALGATAGFLRYTGTGANTWVFDSSTYLTAAITSLGGLTAASQTFANDTNVTITSATSTHTLGWTGQLSVARGGTGASTLTGVLIGNGTGAVTAVAGTASQLLRRNAGNTAYEFFTHDFVSTAGATFTGQIISTLANSTTTGGAQVYLNGTTGNRIDFNTNGSADPAFTTRSVGTKIVLRPLLTGTTLDYAIGIGNLGQSMWVSLPTATSTHSFRVIAGAISSSVFRITGDGNTYALTFNAETINATIGIKAQLSATIDSYNEDDTAFVSANVTGSAGVADYKWYHSPSARFATWSWSANTFDRTYTLPNASGTIPISVNGQTADADGNITISTGGGSAYSVTSVSTTYSETATSGTKIIKATTAGGTFVITLPTAVGNTATIIIKKTAGTAALTVDGFNTETIDGGLNATINKVDESITLVSDNSNWLII